MLRLGCRKRCPSRRNEKIADETAVRAFVAGRMTSGHLDAVSMLRAGAALGVGSAFVWMVRAKQAAEYRAERAERRAERAERLVAELVDAPSTSADATESCVGLSQCDDLCLELIVNALPSSLDLAACALAWHRFRRPCEREMERRVRAQLHVAGTRPASGMVEIPCAATDPPSRSVHHLYPTDETVIAAAARYAGGWGALLAGREGRLDTTMTSRPDYAETEAHAEADAIAEATAEVRAAPLDALIIWDLVRITHDGAIPGTPILPSPGARSAPEWSAIVPLIEVLGRKQLGVLGAEGTRTGCRLSPESDAIPYSGALRLWQPAGAADSVGRPPRFLVSGSFDDPQHGWLLRVSIVAPNASETLLAQHTLEPGALHAYAAGEPHPSHMRVLRGGAAVRLDTGEQVFRTFLIRQELLAYLPPLDVSRVGVSLCPRSHPPIPAQELFDEGGYEPEPGGEDAKVSTLTISYATDATVDADAPDESSAPISHFTAHLWIESSQASYADTASVPRARGRITPSPAHAFVSCRRRAATVDVASTWTSTSSERTPCGRPSCAAPTPSPGCSRGSARSACVSTRAATRAGRPRACEAPRERKLRRRAAATDGGWRRHCGLRDGARCRGWSRHGRAGRSRRRGESPPPWAALAGTLLRPESRPRAPNVLYIPI